MDLTNIDAILFDFGGTLVDQVFFRNGSIKISNFPKIMMEKFYEPFFSNPNSSSLLGGWIAGELTKNDIAQAISLETNFPKEDVLSAMEENCRNLMVFDKVFEWAKEISKTKKTAVVTINSDIFTDVIVEAYSLNKYFSVIVNSCHYKTMDKNLVCKIALEKLGQVRIERALLIDDSKSNCEEFIQAGGNSYFFKNEDQFLADFLIE